ncbi:MAG: hypothetical protein HYV63_00430 [Candidatus Schekmanbacteria bacterium]|nr:hypothetical protein [Candidatus Schekmanbacteria bacterium]
MSQITDRLREGIALDERKAKKVFRIRTYQERLDEDLEWAMNEGSKFFEGKSAVQESLKMIAYRLRELGIDYAVVGGMALFSHGFRRFTEDVDILVTREGLKEIHHKLRGLGYRPPFEGSKNLRDTQYGVKIEFLVAGEFPGDGKPKPVSFPDPAGNTIERDGILYIKLEGLIELKLASGSSNADRMKDLADVIELIKTLGLTSDFANKLNEYVRAKYIELWNAVYSNMKRYIRIWKNRNLTGYEQSLETVVDILHDDAGILKAMLVDGVTIDSSRTKSGCVYLTTIDADVARKYDMHDEAEFWVGGDDEQTESAEGDDPVVLQ